MRPRFEELDWQDTPRGEISLRRRVEPTLGVDVYEVKLGEEFLMSSLFTAAEEELARLGLRAVGPAPDRRLDVLVGGLGLGYTAVAALEDPRVHTLTVVDAMPPVVDWHRRGLLPDAAGLADDPRCRLVVADVFALLSGEDLPAPGTPAAYDVILLDVDHTPRHLLHPDHAGFYTEAGLSRMRERLRPDGAFALWSDDPPDADFLRVLSGVFPDARADVVAFPNPLTGGHSSNTVYVASR
jgi:spermidine synthase